MPHGLVHECEEKLRAHFFAHRDPLSHWNIFVSKNLTHNDDSIW